MLRVRLAGGLALESDGRALAAPRSRRARALLAFLAAHPGRHARRELAARFWPDVLDESARASLRTALTELRGALGPEAACVVATRDTVALEGAEVELDGDGVLLAGMDDEWVLALRRDHDERRAAELDALAAAAEAGGDFEAATRHARAAAALDPLLESAAARLKRLAARKAETIAPPAGLARAAGTAFVGRAPELARLDAALAQGSRRLVLLAGEAGAGKTSLALRFAHHARERDGATVLLGRCSEDPLAPFEPFTEVLRQIGSEAARALAGPELDRLLAPGRGAPADDPGARHRLFSAVDDVLTGLAERHPLVLILDDLHWADRPTLLLLGFILRGARTVPLLAVGTYRDTDVGRGSSLAAELAGLRRDGGAERIPVRALDRAEVGELATAWLGAEAAERHAADVHARTGGNAFFAEEVLRGLAEDDTAVPETVRHAVGARRARLSAPADELLAQAAVLGRTVDPALGAEPLLEELLDARLLRAGDTSGLEFTHALVREAVLADLNPLRLARLHRDAADRLIAAGAQPEEIAHHLAEARDPRAAEQLRRAGEHALAMLAYEDAAAHFARAAALAADPVPLLLARGDALLRAGEPGAAAAVFQDAAARAREAGDAEGLARAALGHAGLAVTIIELEAASIALLEEALAALGDAQPSLRSQLLSRLAVELYYAPSRDRSEALSADAVATARETGDGRALALALNARRVALWRPDRLPERLAAAEEMIAVARAADAPELELLARNWRVVDLFDLPDIAEWRAEVRRHGELATRLRMPAFTWYTPVWAAADALHAGRFSEAAELREQAREEGTRAGDRNGELFAEMLRFQEAIITEDWDAVNLPLIEERVAASPAAMAWRSAYTWALAVYGRTEEAREQLALVAADGFARLAFDTNWPSAMGELAEACVLLGDPEPAAAVYERLLPYAGGVLTSGRAIASYGSTERLLGGLAAVLGRREEAIARHEAGVRANEALGFEPWAEKGRRALR